MQMVNSVGTTMHPNCHDFLGHATKAGKLFLSPYLFSYFSGESHYVAHDCLNLTKFLQNSPEYWNEMVVLTVRSHLCLN